MRMHSGLGRSCGRYCYCGRMDLDVMHVLQCQCAIGFRRGEGGTMLEWSSRVTGGTCHASRAHVGAASARRHAILGAKASNSLRSALVAGGALNCGLEHSWYCPYRDTKESDCGKLSKATTLVWLFDRLAINNRVLLRGRRNPPRRVCG
jgi:hypothetical protein